MKGIYYPRCADLDLKTLRDRCLTANTVHGYRAAMLIDLMREEIWKNNVLVNKHRPKGSANREEKGGCDAG